MADDLGSTSYNKFGTGARVGNWVEEEALKSLTGTHRVTTVGDKMLDTTTRVFLHSDSITPKDYKSTSRETHDVEKLAHIHEDRKPGPRERRLQAMFKEEAAETVREVEHPPQAYFETTAGETFVRHSDDEYKTEKGRRVMKTIDGRPIPPGSRDIDMLATVGVSKRQPTLMPGATMHLTAGKLPLAAQAPISIYTQQAATGGYNTTAAKGANPFLRDTKFTNPVAESEKAHAESRDTPVDWIAGVGTSLAYHAASELTMFEILTRVRAKIRERGGYNGIRTLTRLLQRMDSSGDGLLTSEEFADGLRDMGLTIPPRDVAALVAYFDTDKSGRISVEELQKGLAGPMNERRMGLVREAFRRLDKTGDGEVTTADLASAYDVSHHPEFKEGKMTREEVLREFLDNFDSTEKDGVVTAEEFAEYYRGVSAGIPDDDYFELMMRNAWHISGGSGWSANTTCKRVLVRFNDGREEVIEIEDDLGMRPDDVPAIRAKLRKQGVTNIKEVKLHE